MACISYNTPPLLNTVASILDFLDLFIGKMVEAGCTINTTITGSAYCLRGTGIITRPIVLYDRDTFVSAYSATASIITGASTYEYISTIAFNLPVGDGSVVFMDDPVDPAFKRVKSASYDNTPVTLLFHVCNANVRAVTSDQASLSNKQIGVCVEYVSKSGVFSGASSMSTIAQGLSTKNHTDYGMSGDSYISLTDRSLSVLIGKHNRVGIDEANGAQNDIMKYMIRFHLYRKNGEICSITTGSNSPYYNATTFISSDGHINTAAYTSLSFGYNYYNGYSCSGQITLTGSISAFWPNINSTGFYNNHGDIYASNASLLYVPTFKFNKDLIFNSHEYVYQRAGKQVIGNYLNVGNNDRAHSMYSSSAPRQYSYAVLHELNVTYTTATAV